MEQPVYFWTPDIAPAGIGFYYGKLFPEWQGNLFVSALAARALVRLVLNNDKVVGFHVEQKRGDLSGVVRQFRRRGSGITFGQLLPDRRLVVQIVEVFRQFMPGQVDPVVAEKPGFVLAVLSGADHPQSHRVSRNEDGNVAESVPDSRRPGVCWSRRHGEQQIEH